MTPYETLKAAVRDYGEAAMENLLRCRAFGRAVVDGLPGHLGAPEACVSAVPADGPFDPSKDYGDAAFSFDAGQVIRLEPITFGICVVVPNAEDSGSLWLRVGVRLEISGDTFDVFVANQPMRHVSLDWSEDDDGMRKLYETVHKELMGVFELDLLAFQDERYAGGIGFLPNSPAT